MPSIAQRLVLVVAAAALLFSSRAEGQTKTLRIGFNAPDMSQTDCAYALSLLQKEGQILGVTIFAQDGKGSVSQQSGDLMNTVNMGLDGVILIPNDDKSLSATVNDVLAAHTPIVTIVHRLDATDKPLCQLGGGSGTPGLNAQASQALRAIVAFVRDHKPLVSAQPD